MKIKFIYIICIIIIYAAACSPNPDILNVMTHDSFSVSEEIIQSFEDAHHVRVNFLLSGDAGSMINQAVLTKDTLTADVLYGVDNTFLSRALKADIFEPYESPLLESIPVELELDNTFRALPVDYGDVCINYDKKYFQEESLPIPGSLSDLTKPEYKGLLVVENPATSSPGLSFLLATIAEYGQSGYLDYWQQLLENDTQVVNDWETAYYSNFSGSSGKGSQPMVVSYASSPAAEVFFSETALDEAPTSSLVGDNMCFRQIEFIGILAGTKKRDLAEKFVDFMLDIPFQEDIPLNMFVFPANEDAALPVEFINHVQTAAHPANLPLEEIAANREAWIESWRSAVLN